jgi:2-methylcitrate dehydratase PrpD
MLDRPTQTKRLLSHVIAEWACALKSEHLSPAAIQAAKLFRSDSIGYALGGSQQDNARILLRDYRALSGGKGYVNAFAGRSLSLPATGTFLRNFGRQQNQIS